jgi:hypothetical protein
MQRPAAQDLPSGTQQQLESLAELSESELDDDALLQELASFKERPLNLNQAEAEDLHVFTFLSALQIQNLLSYRKVLGNFISVYELQSIPGWDLGMIRKLLPFITIRQPISFSKNIWPRFKNGTHFMLVRSSRVLEGASGYDTSLENHYQGSPNYLLVRYQYKYSNSLQYGFTAEKDAGEQFFKAAQSKGFDFYSFHLFARNLGCVKAIALGDFSVNLGQGLTQWQSLAFLKGSEVVAIKRQAPVLKPYTSAGEFYFNRGAGITIQKGKAELTLFGSVRSLDANLVRDTNGREVISSFISSGLHRTQSEILDKAMIEQNSMGGNLSWKGKSFHVGFNTVYHSFSRPVEKRAEPYNRFALRGSSMLNMSADYSFTYRNFHFFGEAAADQNNHKAFLNGLLTSLDPKVDLSVVHRYYEKDYVTVYGRSFSENTMPVNEKGLFIGLRIRPNGVFTINAYSDVYQFAWLKYRTDAPSSGHDYLVQLTYQPNKQVELYARFRNEQKGLNNTSANTGMNEVDNRSRQHCRIHLSYAMLPRLTWQNRMDMVWYDKGGHHEEEGFMFFTGLLYKTTGKLSANGRLLFFETAGFNSRIYTYENDVSYAFVSPFFSGTGLRYYINLNYDVSKNFSLWLKGARTIYQNQPANGSGTGSINGNIKSEIRFQAGWRF